MPINCERPIVSQSGKVECPDAVLSRFPAPWAAFHRQACVISAKSQIRGENGDFMSALGQGASQCAYLYDWASAVLKREVKLDYFQNAHSVRELSTLGTLLARFRSCLPPGRDHK